MISIFKLDIGLLSSSNNEFYFPIGVDKLDELMYRALEVIKPSLGNGWRKLFIIRIENSELEIIKDDKELEKGIEIYSKGYLNLIMDEILKKCERNPKSIQMFFTNINDRSAMSYDICVR